MRKTIFSLGFKVRRLPGIRFSVILFALIFSGSLSSLAGEPDNQLLNTLLSTPYADQLVAASGTDIVAWSEVAGGKKSLWVASAPEFKARRVALFAEDDGQRIVKIVLSPDGEFLYYVRGGEANEQGLYPNPQSLLKKAELAIWRVSTKGGEPQRIAKGGSPILHPKTGDLLFRQNGEFMALSNKDMANGNFNPNPAFHIRGAVRFFTWSPDGKTALFDSYRGDHNLVGIYDPEASAVKWIAPDTSRDMYPVWSPDGKKIAFFRVPGAKKDEYPDFSEGWPFSIWVYDLKQDEAHKVWAAPSEGGDLYQWWRTQPLMWGDNDTVVFNSEHTGWLHSYSLDVDTGKLRQLTEGKCEVFGNTASTGDDVYVVSTNCGDIDRRHLFYVNVANGTRKLITPGKGIEMSPVRLESGNYVAYTRSSVTEPQSIYVMGLKNKKSYRVSRGGGKSLPVDKLIAPQSVTFSSATSDHAKIYGQVIMSHDPKFKNKKRPAVVFLHGGPIRQMTAGWYSVDYYHHFYAINQYLAMQGYVVLAVNYRSGVGYGKMYRTIDGLGPHGALEYQDVLGGAKYLQSLDEVNPEKIGLYGGSYGGYLTALGLARNSDVFKAGVDIHGVHDWAWRAQNYKFVKGGGWDIIGEKALETAYRSSPAADIDSWRSPTLFVHGDDDINVYFSNTVDIVTRLRARNIEVKTLILPDETHMLLLHKNRYRLADSLVKFFDKFLREK